MSRPKSGGAAAEPGERIDNKKNGVPQDALKQAVFDKVPVAKKLFTQMDKDKDKKLSAEEFKRGVLELLADEEDITVEHVDALWKQTDTNLDGFISFVEFQERFSEDGARNFFTRIELQPLTEGQKLVLQGARDYIFKLYDHSEEGREERKADERWMKLGFDDTTKFKPAVFNHLCEMFAEEEKVAAAEKGEETPPWVTAFEAMQKPDLTALYGEVELTPKGLVNLARYDKRLGKVVELPVRAKLNYKRRLTQEIKVKPPKGGTASAKPETREKSAGKGKGKKAQKPVVLKTIPAHLVEEWLQHETFAEMASQHEPKPTRAAPAIKNWNITELTKWGLEHSDGSECYIFLTDSFRVEKMIWGEDKGIIIFVSFRTELNGLHTFEWLYHAKLYLDKKEDLVRVDARPVQMFKSGKPYKLPRSAKPDFKNWIKHVAVPDVFVSAVEAKEY